LRHGSYLNDLLLQAFCKEFGFMDRMFVLNPAKKNVNGKAYDRSTTYPSGLLFPENTEQQREKDDPGKNEINDKDKIPGKSMFKKG
jgi:hypothetical protein